MGSCSEQKLRSEGFSGTRECVSGLETMLQVKGQGPHNSLGFTTLRPYLTQFNFLYFSIFLPHRVAGKPTLLPHVPSTHTQLVLPASFCKPSRADSNALLNHSRLFSLFPAPIQSGHLSFISFSLRLGGLASATTPLVKFLEPHLPIEHLLCQ